MKAAVTICVTCDRYAPAEPSRGAVLAEAVEVAAKARGVDLAVRRIDCLAGCAGPCNAALSARGKPLHRFGGLGPADAHALVDAALCYAADRAGGLGDSPLADRSHCPR